MILHLRQHNTAPYRDVILNACLHNITFDPQVEDYKTDYLMEIIDLTPTPDFYHDRIRQATAHMDGQTDGRDAGHLVALTRYLAQRGDGEARQILYDVFLKNLEDEDTLGAGAIIEVDGVAGFIFVVDKIAAIKRKEAEPYAHGFLVFDLEEAIGESEAQAALATLRATNPNVDYYLHLVESHKITRRSASRHRAAVKGLSYTEIKRRIESGKSFSFLMNWGQTADQQDFLQAAEDLCQQDDPQQIFRYLWIFRKRPFPLDPQRLFRLMDVQHPFLSIPAITLSVLGDMQHPAVRDFGLRLIRERRFSGHAVRLLAQNFAPGDWTLIERLSAEALDDETYHSLTISVKYVFEQHPDPAAAPTLLNIYEYGPCSFCREQILLMLKSLGTLSQTIQDECRYDSNPVIRELARNDFDLEA